MRAPVHMSAVKAETDFVDFDLTNSNDLIAQKPFRIAGIQLIRVGKPTGKTQFIGKRMRSAA